ncbi:MAG: preprotein translocase subunit YajC [Lachnospiraceae bacterium]|nr:preprotein translocase subunit YajC [Lachnospiraceae bacterium]
MYNLLMAEAATSNSTGSLITLIIMYVVIFGALYFIMIRPQKKQQKKIGEMLSALEVGDSVLTSSGFYGVVIDITDDTVIVEFGNNKNCRIPMQKSAIIECEKPESGSAN